MNKALSFIEKMSYNEFKQDLKTVFAVVRAIEIIGEAVKNISEDIKEDYPEIPWK
ncbi:MAG: HepT-like ribonuclease domain-containing protein, partial [Candidatus Helarchaeota archaeon]